MESHGASTQFGTDNALIHEAVITGRKAGAGRDFWSELAHHEALFRTVVAVFDGVYELKPIVLPLEKAPQLPTRIDYRDITQVGNSEFEGEQLDLSEILLVETRRLVRPPHNTVCTHRDRLKALKGSGYVPLDARALSAMRNSKSIPRGWERHLKFQAAVRKEKGLRTEKLHICFDGETFRGKQSEFDTKEGVIAIEYIGSPRFDGYWDLKFLSLDEICSDNDLSAVIRWDFGKT